MSSERSAGLRVPDRLRKVAERSLALGWISASSLAQRLAVLLSVVVAGTLGSLEDFGLIGLATGTLLVVTQSLGYSSGLYLTSLAGRVGVRSARDLSRSLLVFNLLGGFALSFLILALSSGVPLPLAAAFALYGGLNCVLQCEAGILNGGGAHRDVVASTALPLYAGVALTVPFAMMSPAGGLAASLSVGSLAALLMLQRPMTRCSAESPPADPLPPTDVFASVASIALSGASLTVASYVVLWRVNAVNGLEQVGYFTVGGQWRSVLFFIPGAIGTYATARFSRTRLPGEGDLSAEARSSFLLSFLSVVVLVGIGIAVLGTASFFRPVSGEVVKVLLAATASGLLVGASTPYLRLVSRLRGESTTAAITAVGALCMVVISLLLPALAWAQTLAMASGYLTHAVLAARLASRTLNETHTS